MLNFEEMTEEEKMEYMEKALQPFAIELKKNILQTIYDVQVDVAKEFVKKEQELIEENDDPEQIQHTNGIYGGLLIASSIVADIAKDDNIELQRNMLEEKLVMRQDEDTEGSEDTPE